MKTSVLKITAILLIVAGGLSACAEKNDNPEKKSESTDYPVLNWAVEFTLKSTIDINLSITEIPEIKALIEEHDVTFRESFQNTKIPDLMIYYTLTGKERSTKNVIIKDFLATGLFEDYVRELGTAYTQIN